VLRKESDEAHSCGLGGGQGPQIIAPWPVEGSGDVKRKVTQISGSAGVEGTAEVRSGRAGSKSLPQKEDIEKGQLKEKLPAIVGNQSQPIPNAGR